MKILNLYAGIGGNRKLWPDYYCPCGYFFEYGLGKYGCPNCCGDNIANLVDITAVEYNEDIAAVYKDYFPNDRLIIADAHQYLLDHYKEFDFIWSSPPCPTHSRIRNEAGVGRGQNEAVYPDMSLYQEIILLEKHFKKPYAVENVIPYYKPLIPGVVIDRHLFWTNFNIGGFEPSNKKKGHLASGVKYLQEFFGFDLSNFKGDKLQTLRNCVHPETGLYILNAAQNIITKQNEQQIDLFES